jgi:hypothetical protein
MTKKSLFILCLLYINFLHFIPKTAAQIIYKGLNNDNSTFLLGATNARKSQCLYKPSDFNTIPNMGEIIKIYYRFGTTGVGTSHDLSPFTIKMGQTTDSIFPPGNTFFTGLTTVRFDSIYTIPAGIQGNWFGIDLQTPFTFDSTKTLIVEIQFYNSTVSNFGTLGNSNTTQKLISADTAAVAQTGFGSTTWQDFGFDYLITTGTKTTLTAKDIIIYPNPSADKININAVQLIEDGTISIFNVYGHLITNFYPITKTNNTAIDISYLSKGVYYIQIATAQKTIIKKFIKI